MNLKYVKWHNVKDSKPATSVVANSSYWLFFSFFKIITFISDVVIWRCLWLWCRGFSMLKKNCIELAVRIKWSNTAKPHHQKTTCVRYWVNLKCINWHNVKDLYCRDFVVFFFLILWNNYVYFWCRELAVFVIMVSRVFGV